MSEGKKIRNKVIKDYINVSIVVDLDCGNTTNEENLKKCNPICRHCKMYPIK